MLAAGPQTLAQLVAQRLTYPVGYQELWIDAVESHTIGQHLAELVTRGTVAQSDGRFQLA